MKFWNIKGFIGPIGDDLPSLIPILFGLAIFFSAFTFAYQAFDVENSHFKYSIKVMDLAKTVKSDSFIADYADFKNSCDKISVSGVSYKILLFRDFIQIKNENLGNNPLSMDTFGIVTGETLEGIKDKVLIQENNAYFECSNLSEDDLQTVNKVKKFDVRLFPVAYLNAQNSSSVDVAVLMVITWA